MSQLSGSHVTDHEQRLADVLSNAADAVCRGELIDLNSMCQSHPDLSDELNRLFGTMLVTDTAGAVLDEGVGSERSSGRFRSLRLPATLGDYELIEEIGRGGMGVVFRARQISLDRTVAVKMILRGRLASESDLQRFLSEATATARLEHPNIVPVYEAGDIEGRAFFSMQLVEGPTLSDLVANTQLPQREAARIISAIARAIGYAHQQGILHRDLKPSNIMVASDGTPLITDFGLAKQADSKTDLTRSGMLVGTPAYMSPEQAGGRRKLVGPPSDVYSLGCVLYFALTGRSPFLAETPMDLVMQVIVGVRNSQRDSGFQDGTGILATRMLCGITPYRYRWVCSNIRPDCDQREVLSRDVLQPFHRSDSRRGVPAGMFPRATRSAFGHPRDSNVTW